MIVVMRVELRDVEALVCGLGIGAFFGEIIPRLLPRLRRFLKLRK